MSTETIALLTILRAETQSRTVLERCDAEIARLKSEPSWNAHNEVIDRAFDSAISKLFDDAGKYEWAGKDIVVTVINAPKT